MGLPSITAALRKVARELFSSTDSGCQDFFISLANGRGESLCPILTVKECCETLYSTVYGGNSDRNCDGAFFELARACLTCRSKIASAVECTPASHTPPYKPANIHMFREVMKTADIPKWTIRNTVDNTDPPQSSRWSATQILTPILVVIVLCLAFALWYLYKTGRLSRLTFILPSMRRSRPPRHRWTIDDDDPSSGALHHVPDGESSPMMGSVLHWRSLSPKDGATDRKPYGTRMGMGALTPVFSKAICSIRRLFGFGPIKVSRVPVSDAFDLEDPVTKADPLDTSRSTTVGRNSGSTLDRIPSPHNVINKLSWSSAALESVLDNGQENYENTGNVLEGDGANDHDDGMVAGNGVMLISKDGENFSLSGSTTSVPIGRRSIEVDRRSIEVVPPSPATNSKQPFRQSPAIARSASTPLLCPPPPEDSRIRPFFSPSTNDLSNLRFHPIPKSSFMSPTRFSKRPAASSGVQPSRKDVPRIHLFTTATPPIDHGSVGSSPYGSTNMSSTRALPPDTVNSPPASPDLQTYIPSDPQSLIPPAVRGAGYNPYQHARSVGAFE